MAEDNNPAAYGKKLEKLGKMFQNPKTKLQDLFSEAFALGLIISFRVEPDPKQSVEELVEPK